MSSVDSKRRVHLVFDKFRGSLTQEEINNIFKEILPATVEVNEYQIADGGEGSLDALLTDRKSTRLNSSHEWISRMPSSA